MSVFGPYSRYYDLLYRDKNYQAEAAFVLAQLEGSHLTGKRILELGCGTGMHAELFARAGYSVHGIDRSAEMLEAAQRRRSEIPPEVGASLTFGAGDVRSYRCNSHFDAVLSLFHVVSYQTSNEDLRATFSTAAAHLPIGGVLAFDFWYGPAVLSEKPEVRIKRFEDERTRIVRLAEPVLHPNENKVDVQFTVLIEDKATGRRDEIHETHPMRYLFLPEIDMLLEAAGMARLSAIEWLSGRALGEQAWSGFVLARKAR